MSLADPTRHCPTCGNHEEEPADYDIIGQDVFDCGACGTRWAVSEADKEKIIIDVH